METELKLLEDYFSSRDLPKSPVNISECETVVYSMIFVDSHFCGIRANVNNKKLVDLHLGRLNNFKEAIEKI